MISAVRVKDAAFINFFISQCFAVCKRHMYCKRVEHMNAGQDIRRSICTVQPFYYICEDIVSGNSVGRMC